MAEERIKRVALDDDAVESVSGGMLSVNVEDGHCYLYLRDDNYQVVQKYDIISSGREVMGLLNDMYWGLEAGSRDHLMIEYLEDNGHIVAC